MHSLDFVSVLIHIPSTKTYSGCELCSSSLSFHPSVAFASRSRLSKCQPAARSRMATAPNLATGLQRWPEEAAERAYQAPCSRSLSRILSAVFPVPRWVLCLYPCTHLCAYTPTPHKEGCKMMSYRYNLTLNLMRLLASLFFLSLGA